MAQRHHYSNAGHYATSYRGTEDREFLFDKTFKAWKCPNCPWYRIRTNKEAWEKKIIMHPVYGFISQINAYYKDIAHHDCELTQDARDRHGFAARKLDIRYEHLPKAA